MIRLKNILALMCIVGLAFSSCRYVEIADADYLDQTIYMPAAVSGIYQVNDTNSFGTYKYQLDLENNKLVIPLGVYRSGVDSKGSVVIDILVNNDTIQRLNEIGPSEDPEYKPYVVIPEDKYSFPEQVVIPDGADNVIFNMTVDLDYLATQPDTKLGVAFEIQSNAIEVNQELNLTVLELNTNFIVPTAEFSITVDPGNDRKLIFTNLSSYAKECVWDFGDGNVRTTMQDTVQHCYADYKEYKVSMTVKGITEKPVVNDKLIKIWQNITADYIKNPGDPFLRSDNRTGVVGNLADWSITDNLKTTKSGGEYYGGYVKNQEIDGTVYMGLMDLFSLDAVQNGKIWQTIDLPAGSYRLTTTPVLFTGENDCYFAVIKGNEMPDAEALENSTVLAKQFFNSMPDTDLELTFTMEAAGQVTIGFVVNTQAPPKGVFNEVMIQKVGLYK